MKAIVCLENGFANALEGDPKGTLAPYVTWQEIADPSPAPGQVVIDVELAAVNPSDEMFVRGLYGLPRRAGVPAGFEGVGRVIENGGGWMGRALMGRRVAFFADASGSWSEKALTGAALCIPVGEEVRAEDAAGFLVNPFTAWALDELVARSGSKSFVMSAAGSQLGKFLIRLAAQRGRRPIAIVRRNEQIAPLQSLGASYVLNQQSAEFDDELRDALKREKPVAFLDAVAGPQQARVHQAMGNGARWVVYGRLDPEPPTIKHPEQFIFQRKRVEGFWLSDWFQSASLIQKARAARAIRKRFERGDWQTDVAEIVPLEDAIERLPQARTKTDGKVFLEP